VIITISRQMGSWGCQVAEEAARSLGYRRVWREVINQAAQRAGAPEIALATIDEIGLLGIKPRSSDLLAYHRAVRQIMLELAQKGNIIIVGRAGQVILQDYPGTLHVRIVAPRSVRVARIAAERAVSLEQAGVLVELSDRSRTNYLKRFYHADLNDADLYDLMINTEHLGVSDAARLICAMAERVNSQKIH
jgi:cytidylate kinase